MGLLKISSSVRMIGSDQDPPQLILESTTPLLEGPTLGRNQIKLHDRVYGDELYSPTLNRTTARPSRMCIIQLRVQSEAPCAKWTQDAR